MMRVSGVLAIVVAGTALVVVDMTIVAIGLADVARDLRVPTGDVDWVIVSYLLAMGAVTQVVGSLADRLGRRRTQLIGLTVFGAASLACGLAPGLEALVAARIVQGIGAAAIMTGALPLLSQHHTGEARNMAIATWGSASSAAALVAPLLGGVLVDGFGWRAVFLVNVPICIVALLASARVLPADPAPDGKDRAPIDRTGTVLLIGALALLGHASLRGGQQDGSDTLWQVAAGAALMVAFLLVERRAVAPVLALDLFRRAAFTGSALSLFLSRVLTVGGTVYLVLYVQESLGLGPTASGLLLLPVFLAQIGVGQLSGKLMSRFPPGHLIAAGFLAKAVGAGWLALIAAPTTSPWLLVAPLLIWGAGGGMTGAPVFAVAMDATAGERAGMVAGTISTLASIGAGIGTAALGLVHHAWAGPQPDAGSIAAGTAAVLVSSGVLALVATTAVLLLIGGRTLTRSAPA